METVKLESIYAEIEPIGLCAICVLNLNAADPTLVSSLCTGMAREYFGCRLEFPSGFSMPWNAGVEIVPGYQAITEIASFFGTDAKFSSSNRVPIMMFAYSTWKGTTLCTEHMHQEMMRPDPQRARW